MTEDRVALHERMALAKWEGYAKAIEKEPPLHIRRGVHLCTQCRDHVPPVQRWCCAVDTPYLFSDEVAAAAATHAPDGDILTPEWRMWWKYMPDDSLVSPFECIAGDWDFCPTTPTRGHSPMGRY